MKNNLPYPYGNNNPVDTVFGDIDYAKLQKAIESAFDKKEERLNDAIKFAGNFYRKYPNSGYTAEVKEFEKETKEELDAKRGACDIRKVPYTYDRQFREYPLADARARVAAGEAAVVRIKMPTSGMIEADDLLHGHMQWDATTQDDFIILKADGFPPYHFAAMVDDHDMQISHVLRGDDWLPSLPKHIQIFRAFEWEPPIFVHTPNVLAPGGGKKLSKRHGAKPILGPVPELKDGVPTGEITGGLVNNEGYLPDAIVNFLALIGWSAGDNQEVFTREELINAFTLERISRSGGAFDQDKLLWMNGLYIRQMSPDALYAAAEPFILESGLVAADCSAETRAYAAAALARPASRGQSRVSETGEERAWRESSHGGARWSWPRVRVRRWPPPG